MSFAVGDRLRFLGEPHPETGALQHLGDANADPAEGCVRIPLFIGSVGTVEERVSAEQDGAGSHEADCTVLSFPVKGAFVDADGNPQLHVTHHRISFEDDQLDAWFERAEGDE